LIRRPVHSRVRPRTLLVLAVLVLTSCQTAYYAAMEKLGYPKRALLVSRVQQARDSQQARPLRPIFQKISVMARRRREARVKIVADRLRPQHRGARGQVRVDAANPRRLGAQRFGVEMDDLRRGMHPCIGPARGDDANRMARDPGDRIFKRVLHAAARRLRLESTERGARVLDA